MCGPEVREMQPADLAKVSAFTKLIPAADTKIVRLVATLNGAVVGYAEMSPTFFQRPFISLLSVHPEYRHQGIASALVTAMEATCPSEKLFTSTNNSNVAMQALMAKMGYRRCGLIEDLDEGDPELIFFKRLRSDAAPTA